MISFQADTNKTVQLPVGGDFVDNTFRPFLYCLKAAILLPKSFSLLSSPIFTALWHCQIGFLDSYCSCISLHSHLSHFCYRHLSLFNMSISGLKAKLSLPLRRNRDKSDANESIQPLLGSRSHVGYADTGIDLHSISSSKDKTSVDPQNQPAAGAVSPSQSAVPGLHDTLPPTLIHLLGLHRQVTTSSMLSAYHATTTMLFPCLGKLCRSPVASAWITAVHQKNVSSVYPTCPKNPSPSSGPAARFLASRMET